LQQKKIRIQAGAKHGLSFPNCRIVILRLRQRINESSWSLISEMRQVTLHEFPGMIVAPTLYGVSALHAIYAGAADLGRNK